MTPTYEILGHKITERIQLEAGERLTGRARACADNAIRFLVRADRVAGISETVSYFCITHATEEAVACVIAAAKEFNYRDEAKLINPRDHIDKATVAQFAQMAVGLAEEVKLFISTTDSTKRLLFRADSDESLKPIFGVLSLPVFSFNEDANNPDGSAAFERFVAPFRDEDSMVRHIKARARHRNDALYAKDGGAPSMTQEQLYIQLREHTLIALGLIWAAVDMSYHDRREPFVLQLLSAIKKICTQVKKNRVCKEC